MRSIAQVLRSASSMQFKPEGSSSASFSNADLLDLVNLTPLMKLSSGRTATTIGLIDGPVLTDHPDLSSTSIREISGRSNGTCARATSIACMHGTFVAGILSARRGSKAPAICPGCTLLVRPIFTETTGGIPSATPAELATAVVDCIDAGAHVVNLSAAIAQPSSKGAQMLEEALDYSAKRGVVVVAAAGNDGTIGSSTITRHPWVIPVVASDLQGRPIGYSNFSNSIGRRGLSAPGNGITSLGSNHQPFIFSGTSAAAPFVTGAIALLQSIFPNASASAVNLAVTRRHISRRATIVPLLLDAWSAYQQLAEN